MVKSGKIYKILLIMVLGFVIVARVKIYLNQKPETKKIQQPQEPSMPEPSIYDKKIKISYELSFQAYASPAEGEWINWADFAQPAIDFLNAMKVNEEKRTILTMRELFRDPDISLHFADSPLVQRAKELDNPFIQIYVKALDIKNTEKKEVKIYYTINIIYTFCEAEERNLKNYPNIVSERLKSAKVSDEFTLTASAKELNIDSSKMPPDTINYLHIKVISIE